MRTANYEGEQVEVLAIYTDMGLPAFPPGDYAWIEQHCNRFFVPLSELTDLTEDET